MDITKHLLIELSQYVCPLHGENTYFKIDPHDGKLVTYCCELCKDTVEKLIKDNSG